MIELQTFVPAFEDHLIDFLDFQYQTVSPFEH